LIWGAAWLYKATNTEYYLKYVMENIHYLEYVPQSNDPIYVGGSFEEFGWDSKHAGINVLLSGVRNLYFKLPCFFLIRQPLIIGLKSN
jgi:endoglucanase